MIGDTFAHFRVTAKLGEGGMGEVYQAEDPRLGRSVAIKVLPQALVSSSERVARFEREARVLASLNHPNVAGIYDVGEARGTHFLVMELAPGETLSQRIARGPIPVEEAVAIALQIAAALEAAHERGIVHRDLKPANVKVGVDGKVKVLDFGLAKALSPDLSADERAADLPSSPTLISQATEAGVVLGTAAYMSPEQARGQPVDARADIWAFGCVLFEMLSGERAFAGEAAADVLGAVVAKEPNWSALPRALPAPLRRLMRRCLAKDARERLHHIADARLELTDPSDDRVDEQPDRSALFGVQPLAGLAIALAVGLLLGVGATLWSFAPPSGREPPRRPSRWTVDVAAHGQLDLGGRLDPLAVAPDGRTLAFVSRTTSGERRLYVRSVDELQPRLVPGSEGASNPFFAPDGRWLGFFAGGRLKKAPVGGGAPTDVAATPLDNLGASWGEDGTIVFASYASGLWRVSDEGGEPESLTPGQTVQHRWPQLLPGGHRVLFVLQTLEGPRLAILDLRTQERVTVQGLQQVTKARYLPNGHLVFAQAGGLLTVAFDPQGGRVLGTPVSVLSGLSMERDRGSADFEVAAGGTLIYVEGEGAGDPVLTWVDRDGREEIALDHRAPFAHPHISPDGNHVAVEIGSEVGARRVEVIDLQRGTRNIIASEGRAAQPVWHPDGRRVAIVSDRAGNWDLYLTSLRGPRSLDPLLVGPLETWLGSFAPNGAALAFYQVDPTTARDIWVLDVSRGGDARPYRATPANERGVRISPDGRWLAYVSNESGRDEVYAESFPEPGTRWTVSASGGTEPVWSRDGRELYYREGQRMLAVTVEPGEDLDPGVPRLLFEGRYEEEIVGNPNYDVSPDGRFLMIRREEASSSHFHVVLDWDRELRAALGEGFDAE